MKLTAAQFIKRLETAPLTITGHNTGAPGEEVAGDNIARIVAEQ